jgi:ABC-2 type transport system ATP-binding protein
MLTGILVPTGGHVRVAGLVPMKQRRELAARIGVVFGQRSQLWWDLPLIDSLRLLRHLYRVLYLDEPTIGLDVVAKARIREFLLTINAEQGVTVLLTTHDMDDIETLCPRMVIIDHGRKLYDGTVANIRERFGGERVLVAVLDSAELARLPHDAQGGIMLDDLPQGVRLVRAEGPRLWLGFGRNALPAHELVGWLGGRYRLHDVTFQEPEIEDVIRRIYEEGLLLREVDRFAS